MYLDSPFECCPMCGEYVLLDQTQAECAREHHCGSIRCPLAPYFCGHACKEEGDDDTPPEIRL